MAAIIIDGKGLAGDIQDEIEKEAKALSPRPPGLAVILVGENPASLVYVRSKTKSAERCGFSVFDIKLPETTTNEVLQQNITELNNNPAVDGILLQLPLPKGFAEFSAIFTISPKKDVDGLHPINQGLLLRGEACPRPCTPSGVIRLIEKARHELGQSADLSGLHAVVVGRSILVGKPLGIMLLERNCTVTFCHSKTRDLKEQCRKADVLVVAIGKTRMVKSDWIKPGAIVIDVGINRDQSGRLCGDVDFEAVSGVCGAITPVPGGVGPMTIAMLLSNTLEAAKKNL